MKKTLAISIVCVLIIIALFVYQIKIKSTTPQLAKLTPSVTIVSEMKITSSAFGNNQKIPSIYSCDGEGVNPPLSFSDVPSNAKSLVLIVDDPDAPIGTFVHWVVFNIPPQTSEIKQNSVPQNSIQGLSGTNKPGFVGACPPSGTHRYFFKLYALDLVLSLTSNADKKSVEDAMQNHILTKAELLGLYSRGK